MMERLEERIQSQFQNKELLSKAMTHKSFAYESSEADFHNEKLEFLGDAVLDLVLGEYLYELFQNDQEGALSKKRASLVNEDILSAIAKEMNLSEYLRLGKGESLTGGALKPRLLASALEALIGAIYLDQGFSAAKNFTRREFRGLIENLDLHHDFAADYKTRVQELAQKLYRTVPHYDLKGETGPSHDRTFFVSVLIKDVEIGAGQGRSKKAAEQEAARQALLNMNWQQSAGGAG